MILASLGAPCVVSSAAESDPVNPQWEVCRRTVIAYFQAEMHWVFTSRYPASIQELCEANEHIPLPPLEDSQITDPCSLHGLVLRYRLSEDGPEVASIGPDRRWGGWKADSFFGKDDSYVGASTAPDNLKQFLHASYCLALASGSVQYPVVLLKGEGIDAAAYRDIEARRTVREPVEVARLDEVAEALRTRFDVGIHISERFFEQETTGLGACFAQAKAASLASLSDALSVLGEACSGWVQLDVWSKKGIVLVIRDWPAVSYELKAFWEMLSARTDAKMRGLESMMADLGPSAVMVLLPAPWFDDESYRRFGIACQRMLGTEERVVWRIAAGICVTGFEEWSQAYFFAERFREFLPSGHDWLEARRQLRQ